MRISAILTCVALAFGGITQADDDLALQRTLRLEEMRRRVEAMRLELENVKEGDQPALRADPLLRFDDPTRAFYDGALWSWGKQGRPQVLVSTEKYEKIWSYELIALTTTPLTLRTEHKWTWKPTSAPFVEQSLPDEVGDTAALRRKQARELARRFEAAEYIGEESSRTVLRLAPRPIYEYDDPDRSLLYGSLSIFVNGTNPEVLLLLEARSPEKGKPAWQFAFAPLSTAPLEVKLGERTVWQAVAQRKPQAQSPYAFYSVPSEVPEE